MAASRKTTQSSQRRHADLSTVEGIYFLHHQRPLDGLLVYVLGF